MSACKMYGAQLINGRMPRGVVVVVVDVIVLPTAPCVYVHTAHELNARVHWRSDRSNTVGANRLASQITEPLLGWTRYMQNGLGGG